jgi:hypothetical protein
MLRRTGFKSKGAPREQRDPDRVRATLTPTDAFRAPEVVGAGVAIAKTVRQENPTLLAMARGEACLMKVPGVCCGDRATVVAAHSNWSEHGKSGARKADDCYHVWACFTCHAWLDSGPAPAAEKRARWDAAFERIKDIWLDIDAGMQEATPRERNAVAWALKLVNKTK